MAMRAIAVRSLRASEIVLSAALALAGCAPSGHAPVAIDETTSATILRAPSPVGSVCSADVSTTSSPGGSALAAEPRAEALWSGGETEKASTPAPEAYEREPLHEPNGSTYGDVGAPYPLPGVVSGAVASGASFASGSVASPASPPIPESSFGSPSGSPAPAGSSDFPESSFGP
jgi:hypothetical protein